MTPEDEVKARYKTIMRKRDTLGREIGVRRLRVSQQVKISEMTPALEGDTEMTGKDGRTIRIPRRSIPVVAASVCEIDGQPILFPDRRAALDALMDKLDEEGILAAVLAYGELQPGTRVEEDDKPLDETAAAKK